MKKRTTQLSNPDPAGARSTSGANPYLFVVGAARSGTTLLQRMLDAHPMLAVVNETYWVPRKYRERTGLTRDGLVTDALVPLLCAAPKFERMGLAESQLRDLLRAHEPIRYEQYVSLLFDQFAAARGKPLAGDKTPGYVRRIPQLHELFPRTRFVHIVRDPRDVCLSMLSWASGERTAGQFGTWEIDSLTSAALYWRMSVELGRQHGHRLPAGCYREVRYEDLVNDPAGTLQQLCGFLQLPYDEAMLRFHEGRTRIKPGRSSKAQWLPPTRGLRDWRSQMPAADVERVEAAAGPLIGAFGYEQRHRIVSPQADEQVRQVLKRFVAGAREQQRTLPDGWS